MKKKICLIIYYGFARFLPGSNTKLGKMLKSKSVRYMCCKYIFKKIGKNVNIEKGAWFGNGSQIEIGNNSGIGYNARVLNNTVIGNDVMMGPNLYMLEKTHNFDRLDIPMNQQGKRQERDIVTIGDDCWIGRDVLIIGTHDIKKGSIIGARCVLTKSFPGYSIIGGNPSRLLKSRINNNN